MEPFDNRFHFGNFLLAIANKLDLQFRPARGTECSHKRSLRRKQFLPKSALGIDFSKDSARSGRGTPVAKDGGLVMNDLKFACRQLLKNPGFTAVAVLSLALGIGAMEALRDHSQDLDGPALGLSKLTRATCPASTKFQ